MELSRCHTPPVVWVCVNGTEKMSNFLETESGDASSNLKNCSVAVVISVMVSA